MAKNKVTAPEHEALGEALNKTENFFQTHGKKIIYIIVALIIVGGCTFGYKELFVKPKIEKASFMLHEAQQHLDDAEPNYQAALDGFLQVISEYESTPSGNLAQHYAGVCYLQLGDADKALSYLKKYEAVDNALGKTIQAQNLGLQGDIAVNKGSYSEAVSLFKQAATLTPTSSKYLKKAAQAAKAAGDMATAEELLNKVLIEYTKTPQEYQENEKALGTLK